MLTRVDLQSESPFYLNVRDARPDDSVIVDKIEGLDPPAVDLFMGDYARDGGYYSGRRVSRRNVVFYLTFNPDYSAGETVTGLRDILYRAFMDPNTSPTNDALKIVLKDDEVRDRYLTGYVEKFENDIFNPETSVQISMICPNPFLIDDEATIGTGNGPTLPFVYNGSAESGIQIRARVTTSTNQLNFQLNNDTPATLNYAFQAGDEVTINSKRGERGIFLNRGGNWSSLLYTMTSASPWPELHRRENTVSVFGTPTTQAPKPVVANVFEYSFRGHYWGI